MSDWPRKCRVFCCANHWACQLMPTLAYRVGSEGFSAPTATLDEKVKGPIVWMPILHWSCSPQAAFLRRNGFAFLHQNTFFGNCFGLFLLLFTCLFYLLCFSRCKKHEVSLEKIYNKTQREKFAWAIDMTEKDFVFWSRLNSTWLQRPILVYSMLAFTNRPI